MEKTKSCTELNKHSDTQTKACKTSEIWIRLMDYNKVNFLVVLLYFSDTKCYGEGWAKEIQDLPALFFTIACESTVVSNRKFKKNHWMYNTLKILEKISTYVLFFFFEDSIILEEVEYGIPGDNVWASLPSKAVGSVNFQTWKKPSGPCSFRTRAELLKAMEDSVCVLLFSPELFLLHSFFPLCISIFLLNKY